MSDFDKENRVAKECKTCPRKASVSASARSVFLFYLAKIDASANVSKLPNWLRHTSFCFGMTPPSGITIGGRCRSSSNFWMSKKPDRSLLEELSFANRSYGDAPAATQAVRRGGASSFVFRATGAASENGFSFKNCSEGVGGVRLMKIKVLIRALPVERKFSNNLRTGSLPF